MVCGSVCLHCLLSCLALPLQHLALLDCLLRVLRLAYLPGLRARVACFLAHLLVRLLARWCVSVAGGRAEVRWGGAEMQVGLVIRFESKGVACFVQVEVRVGPTVSIYQAQAELIRLRIVAR